MGVWFGVGGVYLLPLIAPPPLAPLDLIAMEMSKLDLKEYHKRMKTSEANMGKVFSLVLGQCSQTIHDRLKALVQWEDVNHNTDVIELLQLIQTSLYNHTTMKRPFTPMWMLNHPYSDSNKGSTCPTQNISTS